MLKSLKEILTEGKDRGIAVGAFNTPNLECLLAVLGAAERLAVPVIISHAQLHENVAPLDMIGPVMVALAKRSKVNVCVHLDHGEDEDYCKRAAVLGFTSLMIDSSTKPYEENVRISRKVVDFAHPLGISVEAELGRLPNREGGVGSDASGKDLYTDADLVPDFVEQTGVDALAIAFGTAHGIYKTRPVLNLDVITQVKAKTDTPLVMHGGSGITADIYREVIHRGIAKINYYTYMSYAGYEAARKLSQKQEAGFFHDMAQEAQNAMQENVLQALKVFSGIE